jgi:cysteine desulfurase family protein (TIGR01976 family)
MAEWWTFLGETAGMTAFRSRFPGVRRDVARFDGPAGTLMVDTAIDAMAEHLRSGESANVGGAFDASRRTGQLVARARETVAELLGAPADGVVFGANMTTLTFAFTRTVARDLGPGDEIVCTTLDHDANVTPWVMAAADRGARVVFAEVDPATGRLPVDAVTSQLTDRTRWVAVSGASNLLGTIPDVSAITSAAHDAGARVFVDAVHLAPHRRIDVAAIGCDVLVTSPYKWYGPHAGVLVVDPALLAELTPYKVRPAPDAGPPRLETGTPSFEAIAAIEAAARFLLDSFDAIAAHEREVFEVLLEGLHANQRVTVHGPQDRTDRTPTVLFSIDGVASVDVAAHLAAHDVAVWPGHSYAVEAARAMHLDGVRAGVVAYVDEQDVQHLLDALPK